MTGRARVFISCGQKTDEEIAVALEIQKFLTHPKQGYLAYQEAHVLRHEQSTASIREVIFHKLKYETEYFLFIDFRRDMLRKSENQNEAHRGSLYSHQELAIASFLNLPIIAFRQKGVKEENEGMASTMTLNAIQFDHPSEIIGKLESKLAELRSNGGWDPNHRNELSIEIYEKDYPSPRNLPQIENGEIVEKQWLFYHLRIENKNKYIHAKTCAAFLSKCVAYASTLHSAVVIETPVHNLKWGELRNPTSYIFKESFAVLAAICIAEDDPTTAYLYRAVDLMEIPMKIIKGPGEFCLEYTIVSENFSTVKAELKLTLGAEKEDFKFELIHTNLPG